MVQFSSSTSGSILLRLEDFCLLFCCGKSLIPIGTIEDLFWQRLHLKSPGFVANNLAGSFPSAVFFLHLKWIFLLQELQNPKLEIADLLQELQRDSRLVDLCWEGITCTVF